MKQELVPGGYTKPQPKMGITPKMAHMKTLIQTYVKENGFAPSYVELRDMAKIKAVSGVHRICTELVLRGHAIHRPGCSRSIQILD